MNKAIRDLSQVITLQEAFKKDGRKLTPSDLSIIKDATVIYNEEEILWVGKTSDEPKDIKIDECLSKPGHVLTPSIVDSHTHLVFGGDRSFEYTLKLNGADYTEIANAGGGILNTMQSTLKTNEEELYTNAVKRVEAIYAYGVKTIEVKSGYALTYDGEKKLTRIISRLKAHFKGKVRIHNTFMAAHAVPSSFDSSSSYLNEVVIPLMKELKEDIDSVDIFFEQGYFTKEDTQLLFNEAKKLNIPSKIHADEFNDNKGALLAAKLNSLSADHLLCTGPDGIEALASSKTVATLLPGTALFLGKELADARAFLDAGAKLALASDYNPGSCHCDNLLLIASMTAKNLKLNIAELWCALTFNASCALGIDKLGIIQKGFKPEFSLFEVDSIDQITYSWGKNFNRQY